MLSSGNLLSILAKDAAGTVRKTASYYFLFVDLGRCRKIRPAFALRENAAIGRIANCPVS